MDSEVRTTTEGDKAASPLCRTSTRSRATPCPSSSTACATSSDIVFLVLYTIVIQSTALPSAYPYSAEAAGACSAATAALGDVLTRDGIWEYLENHLIDVVYGEIDTPQEGDDDAAATEVGEQ